MAAPAICLVLILTFGIGIGVLQNTRTATDFYSRTLAQANTEETVTIGAQHYRVVNGVVYQGNTQVSSAAALPALKLAYHVTLARRDPLLALPGTNPTELREAVSALIDIKTRLAALQPNETNAKLALQLYPTNFLLTAANLEEARQAFMASPTPESKRAYEVLVPGTVRAKDEALRDFTRAFAVATATSTERVVLFGGVLSSTTIRAALDTLAQGVSHDKAAVVQRIRCSTGLLRDCASLPRAPLPQSTDNNFTLHAVTTEVLNLWDTTSGVPTTRTIVRLPYSTCLPQAGPIQIALSTRNSQYGPYARLTYADDIFFYRLSSLQNSPYGTYMQQTYGSHYSVLSPFKFYVCPQVGADFGTALAIARMTSFTDAHPDLNRLTLDERHEFEELALMLQLKSGGLEDIVKDIAAIMSISTEEPLKTVSNLSVSYQFLTHSAFASLFSVGTPADVLQTPLFEDNPDATKSLQKQIAPYSSLRGVASRSGILHDLRSFVAVENKLASTTPSIAPAPR